MRDGSRPSGQTATRLPLSFKFLPQLHPPALISIRSPPPVPLGPALGERAPGSTLAPAIAAPAEEIIGASRRVITRGGCEIAATKLCLWPRDQPQPSPAASPSSPAPHPSASISFFSSFLWSLLCSGAQTGNPQIQQLRINDCRANDMNVGRNIYKKESIYFLSFLQQKKYHLIVQLIVCLFT